MGRTEVRAPFADDVPAVVEVEGGFATCGGGDAAGLGIVVVFYEVDCACVFDLGETVFGIPVEDARDKTERCKRLDLGFDLVAVVVVCGGEGVDGGVLVEGVSGVVIAGGECGDETVGGFFAVADEVVLVGAVGGVVGVIGLNDFSSWIVAPGGAVGSSTGAGGIGSLADVVDGVVHTANGCVITNTLVGFCQEGIAIWVISICDGMSRTGDAADEVAVCCVAVGEGLAWRLESAATDGAEASIGGAEAVGDVLLDGGAVFE